MARIQIFHIKCEVWGTPAGLDTELFELEKSWVEGEILQWGLLVENMS